MTSHINELINMTCVICLRSVGGRNMRGGIQSRRRAGGWPQEVSPTRGSVGRTPAASRLPLHLVCNAVTSNAA